MKSAKCQTVFLLPYSGDLFYSLFYYKILLFLLTSWFLSEVHKDAPSLDPDLPGSLSDSQPKTVFPSYHREPSYFEIPTKDFQQPKTLGTELREIPTKDMDTHPAPSSPPTSTPPVVQSHASFTIEFDDCMPGKIKIKDHVTKFSTRQRKQPAPPTNTAIGPTPAEVMSAESKVADWLVHSDVSMMRRRPMCEDVYSTKSDLAMNIKTLKGQSLPGVRFIKDHTTWYLICFCVDQL